MWGLRGFHTFRRMQIVVGIALVLLAAVIYLLGGNGLPCLFLAALVPVGLMRSESSTATSRTRTAFEPSCNGTFRSVV
jgi:hypothetical protein